MIYDDQLSAPVLKDSLIKLKPVEYVSKIQVSNFRDK